MLKRLSPARIQAVLITGIAAITLLFFSMIFIGGSIMDIIDNLCYVTDSLEISEVDGRHHYITNYTCPWGETITEEHWNAKDPAPKPNSHEDPIGIDIALLISGIILFLIGVVMVVILATQLGFISCTKKHKFAADQKVPMLSEQETQNTEM